MKIPQVVKVGGHPVKVRIVDSSDLDNTGDYNNYYKLIRLVEEADTPESSVSEALMHEIFECINIQNNLNINHTALTVLSEFLFQVIRDNQIDFRKRT